MASQVAGAQVCVRQQPPSFQEKDLVASEVGHLVIKPGPQIAGFPSQLSLAG